MKFKVELEGQELDFEAKDTKDAMNLILEHLEVTEETQTEARSDATKEAELIEAVESIGGTTRDLREAKTLDEQLDQALSKIIKRGEN